MIKILVVDDAIFMRSMIRDIFARGPFVIAAVHREAAMAVAQRERLDLPVGRHEALGQGLDDAHGDAGTLLQEPFEVALLDENLNELPPGSRFRIDSVATEKRIAALIVTDLNGDGKPDLAAGNADTGVSVLLGNGDGTFRGPVPVGADARPLFIALTTDEVTRFISPPPTSVEGFVRAGAAGPGDRGSAWRRSDLRRRRSWRRIRTSCSERS